MWLGASYYYCDIWTNICNYIELDITEIILKKKTYWHKRTLNWHALIGLLMGLEVDSLGPSCACIQWPQCDWKILFFTWPRHVIGREALFCDIGVSHGLNLKHFLMNSIVGLYWQETSMTSLGIRCRHSIGRNLSGIIFSSLSLIIQFNEVSYTRGVCGKRD